MTVESLYEPCTCGHRAEQHVTSRCAECDCTSYEADTCPDGHDWQAEDIADGVVGGGMAHVWRVYCSRCDAEGEEDDLR